MRSMLRAQYLHLLQQFTGFRPQDEAAASGASRMALTTIRQHLEILHPDITGETDDLHIHRYTRLVLLLLLGGVLFPNTSGNLVSLRFLHHLQQLDALPHYSWGAAVLAYLYTHMCRVCAWERFLQLQPPLPPLPPDVAPPFLPLARRWVLRRGNYRAIDAHHNLPLVKDVLDMLEGAQTPYIDDLVGGLPDYCSTGRLIWSTFVPLMCLDIMEHHARERVLCQFGRPQTIPRGPTWEATHYQRDDRSRAENPFVAWLEAQVHTWDRREDLIPPPPSQIQAATIQMYTSWYRRVTRLFIGNPIHQAGGRYRPNAGRHKALIQQYAGDPAVAEYGRQVTELALRTLQRARHGERLDHDPDYVAPEHHQQGRPIARPRGRGRGRAVPRGEGAPQGRGGRRGGGPQQGGVEAPDEKVGADLPGDIPWPDEHPSSMPSYSLQLALPASQVTPLSFGSSSSGAADLSHAQASSQPVMEATLCDAEDTTDAYIQEPDETIVADGPTTPSTDLASPTDNHPVTHPHIKRRRDKDDPDSVSGREGIRLRPVAALKHKGCGTH
ncbi:PREDICTED: serine/threonine-protein phosphatase 7 long form homolog [Nicotiana attenuata]|uniref:serine/threonine-protein phosphatase 7 long form homolog n=1 Tax=Nicotiana attenuata TaxID=49451 RepID=UPI000904A208|nr:PREDICTED: serine/threonine-protein phosphatase 7 long form homolog [Nicotiana attenuata]